MPHSILNTREYIHQMLLAPCIYENDEKLLGKNYDQIIYQLSKTDFYLT